MCVPYYNIMKEEDIVVAAELLDAVPTSPNGDIKMTSAKDIVFEMEKNPEVSDHFKSRTYAQKLEQLMGVIGPEVNKYMSKNMCVGFTTADVIVICRKGRS